MPDFSKRTWLILGLVFLLCWEAYVLYPIGTGRHRVVDNGDAYLHMWNLWWVYWALVHEGQSPYHTSYNGHPEDIPLTFHQLIVPFGLLSVPLFEIGWLAGQVLLFWQYVLPVVGYVGMFVLIVRFRGPPLGGMVAGWYYALSPLYWQNLPRPDSLSYLVIPWLVLAFWWARKGSVWRLSSPVLLGSFVLLLSPYFGASLLLIWGMGFWVVLSDRTYPGLRYAMLAPLVLLVSAFQWVPQVLAKPPVLVRPEVVSAFSADLTAYVLPPAELWWVPAELAWWTDTWTATEPSLYLGWFALGVAAAGSCRLSQRWAVRLGIMGAVFFVLSMGPDIRLFGRGYLEGWMPFGWAMAVADAVRALRAPLRFGYVLVVMVALGLGSFYPRRIGWGIVVAILVVLEMVRGPVSVVPLPQPEALRGVRRTVRAPALVPVPLTDWATQVQYGQTIHHKKLAMIGLSYGVETLWKRVGRNPVLHALYQRESLPDEGWDRLRRQGYGGVIFHDQLFPESLHPLREQWRRTFRRRFGSPVIRAPQFELYRFRGSTGNR